MKSLGIVAVLVVLLSAGSVYADPLNVRPAFDTGTTLDGLQSALDTYAGGDIGFDVRTDQIGAALFRPTGGPPASGSISVVISQGSGLPNDYEFGIYSAATGALAPLFTDGSIQFVTVTFIIDDFFGLSAGDVIVQPLIGSSVTYSGFGSVFGLYATNYDDSETWYSEDSKNGGSAQMLIYEAAGVDVGGFNDFAHHYVAVEMNDSTGGADGSFTDLVVRIESITPVPEPGTLALLGVALVGAAVLRRRRTNG